MQGDDGTSSQFGVASFTSLLMVNFKLYDSLSNLYIYNINLHFLNYRSNLMMVLET